MPQRIGILLAFGWCFWGGPASVAALTVIRLGGEDLPPPELEVPYEFVQLSWAEVDPARHGLAELVNIDTGFVEPLHLDPTVNLVPILEEFGGQVLALDWIGWGPASGNDLAMFDGDPTTAFLGDGDWGGDYGVIRQKSLVFDFGGRFFLERIRFFPRERFLADRFVQRFIIGISDGDPLKKDTREFRRGIRGSFFDFDLPYNVFENVESVIDMSLPTVPVRRLLFEAPENTRGIWEIAELEIYGNGFAPFASYVSNVIDLGAPASLGSLTWAGQQDEGAALALSTRSGHDDDPNTYWRYTFRGGERTRFDAKGRPLNLASYNKLALGARGGITHDTAAWAFWSAAHDFAAGEGPIAGAGPRQFVQVRADFTSSQHASGRLDWVELAVSIPPVAQQAIAEIMPSVVPPGAAAAFTYKVKASVANDDLGFDRLAIDTPARVQSVDDVRLSGQPVAFDVVQSDDTGFVLAVPLLDAQRTQEVLEVDFHSSVFQFGTVFTGRVFNSQHPAEVPQALAWGDADGVPSSERLRVDLTRLGTGPLGALSVDPGVFSPNGDGINDVVEIGCDVLNLSGSSSVVCWVYDVSGRRLGLVDASWLGSGRYVGVWDGRDENGSLLPPGLYVVGLRVETDQGTTQRQAVVSLVY